VVRIALNRGYINRYPFAEYKPKIDKVDIVYLTFEEVNKIEKKVFTIERLKDKINVLRLKLILVPQKGVNNIRNI